MLEKSNANRRKAWLDRVNGPSSPTTFFSIVVYHRQIPLGSPEAGTKAYFFSANALLLQLSFRSMPLLDLEEAHNHHVGATDRPFLYEFLEFLL